MAETGVWDKIMALLGPKAAEAKVAGDPVSMGIYSTLTGPWGSPSEPKNPYLEDMYRLVGERAEAIQPTVTIKPDEGQLKEGEEAAYEPGKNEIYYRAETPLADVRNSLAHELFHFLNQYGPEGKPVVKGERPQHDVIGAFLGTDKFKPASELMQFTPASVPAEYRKVLDQWLMPNAAQSFLGPER